MPLRRARHLRVRLPGPREHARDGRRRAHSAGGSTGGEVPATLSLTLAPSADLGQFQLAVAADYTATMAATVTSSAGDATLTVNDPSPTATGHLVNGTYAMTQPLQVKAANTPTPRPRSRRSRRR